MRVTHSLGEAAMLDVHPPHQAAHGWRDFFVHIATICVGLLIAVGLEQSVEALNRRHEAAELRESLHAESLQILKDSEQTDGSVAYELAWTKNRIEQVRETVWHGQPLAAAVQNNRPPFASPDIPLWRSAKASGMTARLSKGEVNAFSEVEYVQSKVDLLVEAEFNAESAIRRLEMQFPRGPAGEPDWASASGEDRRAYLGLLTSQWDALQRYREWVRILIGAEHAVLAGKTKLEEIYASENASLHAKTD